MTETITIAWLALQQHGLDIMIGQYDVTIHSVPPPSCRSLAAS